MERKVRPKDPQVIHVDVTSLKLLAFDLPSKSSTLTNKYNCLRQIRNAFQTAIALAEYEAGENGTPSLALGHFKKVADASKEFDIYLKNVYGGQSDAHIAMMEQSRIDDYSPAGAMRRAGRASRDPVSIRRKGGRTRQLEPESESGSASVGEEGSESDSDSGSGG